jgi:putative ABC transport system permease protein
VTAPFFSLLGAAFALGRPFNSEEVSSDASVVVLSHGLWTRMFGADPAVIGTVVQIDRRPYTVIGVTNREFEPAYTATQFWTPLLVRDPRALRATVVQTIGRLRAGASAAAASADLQPVLAAARREMPDLLVASDISAIDLREFRFGSRRNALLMLLVIVGALALLATANLANLTFADLSARAGDLALRSLLGGSTRAIVVAEAAPCALLACAGAAAGLWTAKTAAPSMLSLDPALSAAGITIAVDWRVGIVGLCASLLVMAVSVAVPAWRIARRDQITYIAGSRLTDRRGRRIRAWLVGVQTALALMLLSTSALVVATLQRSSRVEPGFDPASVIAGQLRLSEHVFADHPSRVRLVREILDGVRSVPGVVNAGTTLNLFTPGSSFTTIVTVEEVPSPDGQPYPMQFRRVSPGYFETMRIALRRGRTFLSSDTDQAPMVAVVSESFARRFWPSGDALGKRVRRGAATTPWLEIVGVVADVRDAGLTQVTGPILYTNYYQNSTVATPASLVVRTQGDPRAMITAIKQAIWKVDPAQPLSSIVVVEDFLAASLGPQQFRSYLVILCSLFGILLAVVGIYGVTSRSVAERTKEAGIRIALGGEPSAVRRHLLVGNLNAIAGGVAAGVMLSVMVDRSIVSLLPELGAGDWMLRLGAGAILLTVGGLAAAAASRHASQIEPMRALRGD